MQLRTRQEISEDAAGTAALLADIRAARPIFEAAGARADEERTLPIEIVARLRELGLFWLKTPASLGGAELAPTDFGVLLEELAYFDASVAWAVMVGNGTTGTMAGLLPDAGVAEMFGSAREMPIFAGQFAPRGAATAVPDGYRVSGRWSFCSGIEHAQWVAGRCTVTGRPDTEIVVAVPKSQATLHDTWHVAGLQGTGSGDFSLSDAFVPSAHAFDWQHATALRGGPLFRQPHVLFVANELSPVAVGIARRAIDDMLDLAGATVRKGSAAALEDRPVFQSEIAKAAACVRSLQLLYRDAVAQSWDATLAGVEPDELFVERIRAEHTFVVGSCADVVARIFRYGGGRVLALSHPMQRHLRNLAAAAQHAFVTEENYERAGRARLAETARERDGAHARGA